MDGRPDWNITRVEITLSGLEINTDTLFDFTTSTTLEGEQ